MYIFLNCTTVMSVDWESKMFSAFFGKEGHNEFHPFVRGLQKRDKSLSVSFGNFKKIFM